MIKTYNIFNDLAWIALIYCVGDIITTYLALPYGSEGNPIISNALRVSGFTGLIVFKILYIVFLYYAANKMIGAGYLKFWHFTTRVIVIIGLAIIINNTNVYLNGIGVI